MLNEENKKEKEEYIYLIDGEIEIGTEKHDEVKDSTLILLDSGKEPTIEHFHKFLDAMADKYADAYQMNLKRIGLKKLIRDEWCYKETV